MKGSHEGIGPERTDTTPAMTRDDMVTAELTREAETIAPVDDDHADSTLIEWMLDRSPEQRLEALQGFVDSVWELRGGSKAERLLKRLEKRGRIERVAGSTRASRYAATSN